MTCGQKRNGVFDIRSEEAVFGVVGHPLAQQVARLFQQRTAGQAFTHIQTLRGSQPLYGQHAAGIFRHRPQAATGGWRH
ncbi:Uncharacterised protein [Klebsiella pneumoniae]|nr:Uncharacterised protein [Klebsiella pneumoniae]